MSDFVDLKLTRWSTPMLALTIASATWLLLFGISSCTQKSSVADSGSEKAQETTVQGVIEKGGAKPEGFDQPHKLTPEERKRLEEALEKTHLPGPPLPVEPGAPSEGFSPSGPPTEIQKTPKQTEPK